MPNIKSKYLLMLLNEANIKTDGKTASELEELLDKKLEEDEKIVRRRRIRKLFQSRFEGGVFDNIEVTKNTIITFTEPTTIQKPTKKS